MADNLPFASDRPYINVFMAVAGSRLLYLDEQSVDWEGLWIKATNYYKERLEHLFDEDVDWKQVRSDIMETVGLVASETTFNHSNGGVFWNYTRLLVRLIRETLKTATRLSAADIDDDMETFGNSGALERLEHSPRLWTKMFLSMGIDGVVDEGLGIIHGNEPFQAVFFNPKAIKLVTRLDNQSHYERFNHAFEIINPKRFCSAIAYLYKISEGNDGQRIADMIKWQLSGDTVFIGNYKYGAKQIKGNPIDAVHSNILMPYVTMLIRLFQKRSDIYAAVKPFLADAMARTVMTVYSDMTRRALPQNHKYDAIRMIGSMFPNKAELKTALNSLRAKGWVNDDRIDELMTVLGLT